MTILLELFLLVQGFNIYSKTRILNFVFVVEQFFSPFQKINHNPDYGHSNASRFSFFFFFNNKN